MLNKYPHAEFSFIFTISRISIKTNRNKQINRYANRQIETDKTQTNGLSTVTEKVHTCQKQGDNMTEDNRTLST